MHRKGRITFENASRQLNSAGHSKCREEIDAFQTFLKSHSFEEKRNEEISHKEFKAEWTDERAPIFIPPKVLAKAIVFAIRAMKRIDREVYGEIHGRFMWHELRKKRYELHHPAAAFYMIAEYIKLPGAVRTKIIAQEIKEGRFHQDLMDATVNGVTVQVYASKKWGAINLGGHLLVLPEYPLQRIDNIEGRILKLTRGGWRVSDKQSQRGQRPIRSRH